MGLTAIADQAKAIRDALDQWAHQDGGKAFVASDLSHMWQMAWAKSDSPRVIICYMGEDARGDFSLAVATHRVDRHFVAMVTRGRGFNAERGTSLTDTVGNARPLYELTEEARDIIRSLLNISAEFPVDYRGTQNFQMGEIAIDAYQIRFSVATDLPYILNQPNNPAPPIGS